MGGRPFSTPEDILSDSSYAVLCYPSKHCIAKLIEAKGRRSRYSISNLVVMITNQRRFSRFLFEKRVNLVKTHQRCSNNSGGSCLRGGRVKVDSSSRVQVVDCMAQEKWNTGVENLDMERDGQRDILRVNWAVCDFKAVMRQRGFDDNVMNLSSNEKTSC